MLIIPFQSGGQSCPIKNNSGEPSSGLLSRFANHHAVADEKNAARSAVNLLTSTIKADAEQTDLRFCFRIISPLKVMTLQVRISYCTHVPSKAICHE